MVLEYRQKGKGNVSSMRDVGNAVSNDVVGSGYVSNLEAHPISQEEGTIDATKSPATQGVLESFAGP